MGRVENYKPEYYDKLKKFYFEQHPDRKEEYFDYNFNEFPYDNEEVFGNLVVFDEENNIVGCHLTFPTKAKILGSEEKVQWGHDTFLDEKYRGDLGVELMMQSGIFRISFGAGLSEINYTIQKRLKSKFLGIVHSYVLINWKSPFSLLLSMIGKKHDLSLIETKRINSFDLITDVSQLNIPNEGYWSGNTLNIDFIRDAHFIDKRFLSNFNKYYFFAHKDRKGTHDMYFVIRVIKTERGFLTLSLVDVRFDYDDKNALNTIFKAVNKLAVINSIPFVLFESTLNVKTSIFRRKLKDDYLHCVVAPKKLKVSETDEYLITSADTDMDFARL